MTLLTTICLVLTLLAPLASCYSKFARPPEWDAEQDADGDMLLNQHYDTGDKIPILYETNLKKTELWIWQVLDDIDAGAQIEGTGTYWQAQYDIADPTGNTNTAPTDSSSSDETDPSSETNSRPGLSSAATGGVAAGAAIGGLLIVGGIGWLTWRWLARKKQDRPISELPADLPQQNQPDPPQTKAELTGDPVTYPPSYATSPSGIHEVP
ncbi:hypothetical protein FVER53590_09339 [Fusarium verticillioides]|nr:hypothetical protein FVER53590_09339 [Fusarium verticillioides]